MGTVSPTLARYPVRRVRIFSTPSRPAASSKLRTSSLSIASDRSDGSRALNASNPTMSAKMTETSWWSSEMVSSPCLYRRATASGIRVSSSRSFSACCSSSNSCLVRRLRLMSLKAPPRSPNSSLVLTGT